MYDVCDLCHVCVICVFACVHANTGPIMFAPHSCIMCWKSFRVCVRVRVCVCASCVMCVSGMFPAKWGRFRSPLKFSWSNQANPGLILLQKNPNQSG